MSARTPEEDPGQPDELARLPHGRHGLPPEFVAHNQRQRLIASLTALVGEVGYSGATIGGVTAGAGVSSRTFYKYFETVEECYLAAFDQAVEVMKPAVVEAYESEEDWVEALRAGLDALLAGFSAEPDMARLLTAEPFVAGPQAALRHRELIESLAPCLRKGRELAGHELPPSAELGLLGSANSLIGRRAFSTDDTDFESLAPDLMQFLLNPYLGPAEARRLATA